MAARVEKHPGPQAPHLDRVGPEIEAKILAYALEHATHARNGSLASWARRNRIWARPPCAGSGCATRRSPLKAIDLTHSDAPDGWPGRILRVRPAGRLTPLRASVQTGCTET